MPPLTRHNLALALRDLRDGIGSIYIWPMVGWQDIKHRYRRSALGPFWLTLSTGFMIAIMGVLYARLLRQDTGDYLPYLAASYVVWLLLATLVVDSCTVFSGGEAVIRQIKLPLSVHVLCLVWRCLLIFAHNVVIVLVVALWFRPGSPIAMLLAPVGLLVVAVNGIWLGILLGMICARFRDVPQIVQSLMQVAFFLTPVLWKVDMLGRHAWTATFNPFYHLLEIVRAPLLGEVPSAETWFAVAVITLAGYTAMLALFSRYRGRIAYWV